MNRTKTYLLIGAAALFIAPALAGLVKHVPHAQHMVAIAAATPPPAAEQPDLPKLETHAFQRICRAELKAQLAVPATWRETDGAMGEDGRTSSIWFDASNALGMVGHYHGLCWADAGNAVHALATTD